MAGVTEMPGVLKTLAFTVLDFVRGTALGRIPVVAELEFAVNSPRPGRMSLGMLATDHAGYLSFDLTPLELAHGTLEQIRGANGLVHVWLLPFGDRSRAVDALVAGNPSFDALVVRGTLVLERGAFLARGIPSIQNATLTDWRISPASFSFSPSLALGQDECETIVPSQLTVNEYPFRQIIRDAGSAVDIRNAATRVMTGSLLEYRIRWRPIGHSLGQVAYTLPLAPCEQVNIAVVDWSRRDFATRDEDLSVKEQLLHNLHRDRSIDETVNASLYEHQYGGSIMGGVGGSFGEGAWSANGALGGAYTSSSGERDVAADTSQKLSDSIVQASSSMRTLNSTIVVQQSQQESDTVQTRTVTNHNHCHALTMLYYEVLRNFRVTIEWVGTRPLVFVQYATPDFDIDAVVRFRRLLQASSTLLDPALAPCFDAVQKLYCARANLDAALAAGAARPFDSFTIQFPTTGFAARIYVYVQTTSGARVPCILRGIIAGPVGADQSQLQDLIWSATGDRVSMLLTPVKDVGFGEPASLRWGDVAAIVVHADSSGVDPASPWPVSEISAWTGDESLLWLLYDGALPDGKAQIEVDTDVVLPVAGLPPADALSLLSSDERCCVLRLLDHLNTNKLHYLRPIWMVEDPNQRAVRFDTIAYDAGTLLDAIDNRIVAVAGDYVTFPKGPLAPPADGANRVLAERLVSLPARGVFAEAMLGHCNGCEEIDVTRFWDWQQSPCTERAPAITPPDTSSRARDIPLTPSSLPAPVVNIVNPPAAPDPTAMAGALSLLGTANAFRDMSGISEVSALLQKLATGSVSLASAQDQAKSLLGGGSSGSSSAGAASDAPTASQQHDQLQVFRNAEESGDITPDQRQQLASSYLENASSLAAGATPSPKVYLPFSVIGVDVSAAQGTIVWTDVEAFTYPTTGNRIEFAFIKATDGLKKDSAFAANWAGVAGTRILRSAYHFFRRAVDPEAQAQFLFDTVTAAGGFVKGKDLPLVVDVEEGGVAGTTKTDVIMRLQKFLSKLGTLTKDVPIMYTNQNSWESLVYDATDPAFGSSSPYPFTLPTLWISNFDFDDTDPRSLDPKLAPAATPFTKAAPLMPRGISPFWTFWQFRVVPRNEITGIKASVDISAYQYSLADLQKFAGG